MTAASCSVISGRSSRLANHRALIVLPTPGGPTKRSERVGPESLAFERGKVFSFPDDLLEAQREIGVEE